MRAAAPDPAPSPLFAADSFGKDFGARTVLRSASAWARAGRITVLLGRNGCGKTTLLRAAVGLTRAEYGVVRLGGETLARPRLCELAGLGLFYLPDRGLLSPHWTVGRHLEALTWRFPGADPGGGARRLGLDGLLDLRPGEMSDGERRRAEVALAVARRPACLLADEPLGGLAPADRKRVGRALRELAASGAAVLVTGHEVRDLLLLADEVVWMTAGTTHGLGSPREALRHHQFRREYLGLPD